MNLYRFKCLFFTKNKNIKIKRKIDGNINLYSRCIDCSFKKFENIDKKGQIFIRKVYLIIK